jgi:NAD(P)-dependent dehydrogenase (short-subunit alcohol dehydrogenase family)
VLNLGEALHHELAPAGVDVTVLLPGSVDTPVIDALGLRRAALPIRPQPAEAAVRETIAAFLKRRPVYIPGRLMRIMTRLIPRPLSVRMNGRMLGQAARTLAPATDGTSRVTSQTPASSPDRPGRDSRQHGVLTSPGKGPRALGGSADAGREGAPPCQ